MLLDHSSMTPMLTVVLLAVQSGLTLVLGVWIGSRVRKARRRPRGPAVVDEQSQRAITASIELRQISSDVAERIKKHEALVGEFAERVGALDLSLPPTEMSGLLAGEVGRIAEASRKISEELEQAQRIIQRQTQELSLYKTESRTDPLTGLLNLSALDEEMSYLLAVAGRYHEAFGVLAIDIDGLGRVNDRYGEAAGDELVKGVARILTDHMRRTDIVVRYGDDEFVVLLPRCNEASLAATATRIGQIVWSAGQNGRTVRWVGATVSVGGAVSMGMDSSESLMGRASAALERAKAAGGNRAYYHDGRGMRKIEGSKAMGMAVLN